MRFAKRVMFFVVLIAAVLIITYAVLTQPLVRPVSHKVPPVDLANLRRHVQALSVEFYPRSADKTKTLEAAASYVRSRFLEAGAEVFDQPFTIEGDTYRNVIARFGPRDGPVLVIGAHYDSYGNQSRGDSFPLGYDVTTHTPGADDNASGVAGLLELARLLNQMPPRIQVELVAFTLEEPPNFRTEAMGSRQHARALRAPGRNLEAMISLEMIGYFRSEPQSQSYPFPGLNLVYPNRGDFIAIVGRIQDWSATRKLKAAMLGASDLPVRSINALSLIPGVDFSDHASYWSEGFPALMVTDTAFYRNPNYHQAGDTVQTLDFERMAKVIQGVFAATQTYGR